jgi:hypothetical protein
MPVSKGVRWFAHGSLMALAIYLGSVYLIEHATSAPTIPREDAKSEAAHPAANEARFRSLYDAGTQALRDGLNSTALDKFLEAERSADQLTDDQYTSLKTSRLQIAQLYENSGDTSAVQSVYRSLVSCAMREGQARYDAKRYEDVGAFAEDAMQFSGHLTDGKRDSVQASSYLLITSLNALHRSHEAAQAQLRLIDYLKTLGDDADPALAQAYLGLSSSYADEKDWHGVEQALLQAIEVCDRTNNQQQSGNLSVAKNWAQYNLVIAYYQQGETATALSKADEFFTTYSSRPQDPMHPVNVAYHADQFAALALQIAKETNRQDDIDFWQKRAPGGIKIIALHPMSR